MEYKDVRKLLTDHFRQLLETQHAKMDAEGRLSFIDRQAAENSKAIAEGLIEGNETLSEWNRDDSLVERLAAKHGVVIAKDSKEYQWLQSDVTLAYLEYAKEVLKFDDALLQYDLTPAKTDAVTYEPRKSNAMSISTLEQDYTIEKLRVDAWSPKTKIEKEDHFNLVKEILGADTDIASLTALSAKQVKDTLLRYPRNRNKNPLTRGKSLNEVWGLSNIEVLISGKN